MTSSQSSTNLTLETFGERGTREDHVFIGGQYDFMPTLRSIQRFLERVSTPETPFTPIIPYDFESIELSDVIDEDLRILNQCRHAIFDLSDLGGQLIEMEEARKKNIDTLLVYPVRKRVNEPERGRSTVLSFGEPHFGYRTFKELREIVWRFLTKMPLHHEYPPRDIADPNLSREMRRVRYLRGEDRLEEAEEIVGHFTDPGSDTLEPTLQAALINADRSHYDEAYEKIRNAEDGVDSGEERVEVLYRRAAVKERQAEVIVSEDSEAAITLFEEAEKELRECLEIDDRDGRVLKELGYILWRLESLANGTDRLDEAIQVTERALEDDKMPDPIVSVSALNNLAFYCGEKWRRERESNGVADERWLDEAESKSRYLAEYSSAFGAREPSLVETRGRVLLLKGQASKIRGRRDEACEWYRQARQVLQRGRDEYRPDEHLNRTWRELMKVGNELDCFGT